MTETLDRALYLLDCGVSVIPAVGKVPSIPAWAAYMERLPTVEEVTRWFADGDRNLAIICGKVSGLVVVDADNAEAEAYVKEHLPPTPLVVETAKGKHYYYRHPGPPQTNIIRGLGGLDVKADRGYVIGPSSIHETGALYEISDNNWGYFKSKYGLPEYNPRWVVKKDSVGEQEQNAERVATYVSAALKAQVADVCATGEGQRNARLNAAAYSLGRLVGGQYIGAPTVVSELQRAAEQCGLPARESVKTIQSGLRAGIQNPRTIHLDPRGRDVFFVPEDDVPESPPCEEQLGFRIVCASDVVCRDVEWTLPGYIPSGMLTMMAGDGGAGKSTAISDIIARISRGGLTPSSAYRQDTFAPLDSALECFQQGQVLIIAHEDSLEQVLVPRLKAAGAKLDNVKIVKDCTRSPGSNPAFPDLTQDRQWLRQALLHMDNPRLVVIDPISSYSGDKDTNSASEVRAFLDPLSALADRSGVPFLLVHHLAKAIAARKASHRVLGSQAYTSGCRVVLGFAEDTGEEGEFPGRRRLSVLKANLRVKAGQYCRFVDGEGDHPVVEWLAPIVAGD